MKKTHEYREYKYYWFVRIKNYFNFLDEEIFDMRRGDIYLERQETILFRCGYRGEKLKAKVKSITIKDGIDTDLKINNYVFDIEFELIKNTKQTT